jgi:hypothetical protein
MLSSRTLSSVHSLTFVPVKSAVRLMWQEPSGPTACRRTSAPGLECGTGADGSPAPLKSRAVSGRYVEDASVTSRQLRERSQARCTESTKAIFVSASHYGVLRK